MQPPDFDPAEERWAKLGQQLEGLFAEVWRLEEQWRRMPWLAWKTLPPEHKMD